MFTIITLIYFVLVLEAAAEPLPTPSLSQMPDMLDISDSQPQATAAAAGTASAPRRDVLGSSAKVAPISTHSGAAANSKRKTAIAAKEGAELTGESGGEHLVIGACKAGSHADHGDNDDDDELWIMAASLPEKDNNGKLNTSKRVKDPKRSQEASIDGNDGFFLPPVNVPKNLQTTKPISNLVISTTTNNSSSRSSPSKVEVKSKTSVQSCDVGHANSLSLAGSASSRFSEDVNILAPSSLTPSSHDVSCKAEDDENQVRRKPSATGGSGLPSHVLMADLFRGKRTKKVSSLPPSSSAIKEAEGGRPAKRQRMESDLKASVAQGNQSSQAKGDLFGGVASRGTRQKVASGKQSEPIVLIEEESTGGTDEGRGGSDVIEVSMSSEHRQTRPLEPLLNNKKSASIVSSERRVTENMDPVRNSVGKGTSSIPSAVPKTEVGLDPVSNLSQRAVISSPERYLSPKATVSSPNRATSSSAPYISTSERRTNSDVVKIKDDTVETRNEESLTRTPTKGHCMTSSSFLSSRRTKKSQQQQHHPLSPHDTSQISAYGTQSTAASSAMDTASSGPFTALTLNRLQEAVPLTAVSTGGRRSKVTPSVADAIWMEDEQFGGRGGGIGDEGVEDPLGSEEGGGEGFPARNYQPVCDADGFIKARVAPSLKVNNDISTL